MFLGLETRLLMGTCCNIGALILFVRIVRIVGVVGVVGVRGRILRDGLAIGTDLKGWKAR